MGPVFDADNHYYEATDAFTRHLPKGWADRAVQWAEINGRRYHVLGGRVSHAVVNPTFDPVALPGALAAYFRGNPGSDDPVDLLKQHERCRPAYRDRAARLGTLDEQGLESCLLFPTLGMIYEEPLKADPEAVGVTFRAFNRWLEEDWGFHHDDRILAAPYLSLADPAAAEAELEWVLDHGASMIVMRPAAPTTVIGQRSPTHPMFDGFWGRVNEAKVPVVVHASDSGYSSQGYAEDRFGAGFARGRGRPSIRGEAIERAANDFLATMVYDLMFDRFPNLRIASIENGASFLGTFFQKLQSNMKKFPKYFKENPADTFRRNVWVNPFWEDDLDEAVEWMGADRIIFGSDWPHIEGLEAPLDYLAEVSSLSESDQQRVMHDNIRAFLALDPS